MYDYPHTIENGHGEKLTFLRRASDENGEYLEVENQIKPGSGPPMHVHHYQEESLTVVKGKIGYQMLGGGTKYAGEGETVTFKPGEAHRFWNAGDDVMQCSGYVRPPDNIEYFLTEIYDSTRRNGGTRPGTFDSAYLLDRYKSEFDMFEIPGFVRKVIFPISLAIGRLTGRGKKFRDAPEPVRR
jgi:quercetin dioxygenase-like cupin family protein